MQVDERSRTYINEMYSIGLNVDSAGTVRDINPEMAAAKAGIAPGMKIIRVNDGDFSLEGLRNAVIAAKDPAKGLTIQAQNGKETGTYKLAYSEGEKFPHLVRDGSKPDYLSAIAKPK